MSLTAPQCDAQLGTALADERGAPLLYLAVPVVNEQANFAESVRRPHAH